MNALRIESVSRRFGAVAALHGVDLVVPAGSRTVIVGASGSGKTTLLRLVAGFERPDAGRIVLGDSVLAEAGGIMVPAHRRQIGYVPQDGALFPHLSVGDNIGFGIDLPGPEKRRRIGELAEMVALEATMLARAPHELSGGQQQRVALARALAQRPRLMLLDEPFSALDTGLRAATRKAVAQLLESVGMTVILVTHDQGEALSFAGQLAVMRAGRLAQVGAPMDVYLHPADEATASFLGDAIILPGIVKKGQAECLLGILPVMAADGPVRLMLRPEQIRLEASADAPARVIDVDFTGPTCLVTVQPAGDAAPLLVRSVAQQALQKGDAVRLSVSGPVHVLPRTGQE